MTWQELAFNTLCFIAAILSAYNYLEEEHQKELKALVPFQRAGDDPAWRRRRGLSCSEDWVNGGLTLGGAWTISAFAAWGVHELYRRLRILLSKDIERNPGPLKDGPLEEKTKSGSSQTPGQSSASTTAAESSAVLSGFGLFTTGARKDTERNEASLQQELSSAMQTSAGLDSTNTADHNTAVSSAEAETISDAGSSTHDAGSTVADSPTKLKEKKDRGDTVDQNESANIKEAGSETEGKTVSKRKSQRVRKQNGRKKASGVIASGSVCEEGKSKGGAGGRSKGKGKGKGGNACGKVVSS